MFVGAKQEDDRNANIMGDTTLLRAKMIRQAETLYLLLQLPLPLPQQLRLCHLRTFLMPGELLLLTLLLVAVVIQG